jgi:hypothetical protein
MAEERWLYGSEALAIGFATEAPEPIKAFASIAPPPADRFRQLPDDLKAMAGIMEPAQDLAGKCPMPEPPASAPEPICAPESELLEPELANVTSLSIEQPISRETTAVLPMTVETTDNLEATRLEERDRVKALRGMAKSHNLPGDFVDHLIELVI